MFHHEGESAVARAAAKYNSLYCLSSLSTTTIEEISAILPPEHPKLFQIYVWKVRTQSIYNLSISLINTNEPFWTSITVNNKQLIGWYG